MKDLIDIRLATSIGENGDKAYKITLITSEEVETMTIDDIEEMLNYMPETKDDLYHMLFDYYESKIVEENKNV